MDVDGSGTSDDALERSWEGLDNALPEARELAAELDRNHAPEPGALQDIGTCRTCGLLIAKNRRGVWVHRPSAGELDAGRAWIGRTRTNTSPVG